MNSGASRDSIDLDGDKILHWSTACTAAGKVMFRRQLQKPAVAPASGAPWIQRSRARWPERHQIVIYSSIPLNRCRSARPIRRRQQGRKRRTIRHQQRSLQVHYFALRYAIRRPQPLNRTIMTAFSDLVFHVLTRTSTSRFSESIVYRAAFSGRIESREG